MPAPPCPGSNTVGFWSSCFGVRESGRAAVVDL